MKCVCATWRVPAQWRISRGPFDALATKLLTCGQIKTSEIRNLTFDSWSVRQFWRRQFFYRHFCKIKEPFTHIRMIRSCQVTRMSVRCTVRDTKLVVGENVPFYQTGGYKKLALVADGLSARFVSRRKSIHRALSSPTDTVTEHSCESYNRCALSPRCSDRQPLFLTCLFG